MWKGKRESLVIIKGDVCMNRGAQVATFLLPIVTLVLVILSLFAMASFNNNSRGDAREWSEIMLEVTFAEQYVLKSADVIAEDTINCDSGVYGEDICEEGNLKRRFQLIAATKDVGYFGAGNFFGEIRNGKFSFVGGEGSYSLEFENELFVQAGRGRNEVKRIFGFDKSKDL